MVPDSNKTFLGLEYFCFEGDSFWDTDDEKLIELAKGELEELGFVDKSDVIDGMVVRMPKAYPIYDSTYKEALGTIREFLNKIQNFYPIGRNGSISTIIRITLCSQE